MLKKEYWTNRWKKALVLTMAVVLAAILIFAVFYNGITEKSGEVLPDSHQNLLVQYQKQIDFKELFTKDGELTQVATRYSVLYKNQNLRRMYVCSLPVRNYESGIYSFAVSSIKQTGSGTYMTENSEQKVLYEPEYIHIGSEEQWFRLYLTDAGEPVGIQEASTFYGSSAAVWYEIENGCRVAVSPSYNGAVVTCYIDNPADEVSFPVEFRDYRVNNEYYGCVLLSEKDSNPSEVMQNNTFVISQPLIAKKDGSINTSSRAVIEKSTLRCSLPEDVSYPVSLTFTINYYCENMFFDCAAYQKEPTANHIFDSYILYDSRPGSEVTYNYMKFNIRSFTPKKADLLNQIVLNLYVLYCHEEVEIEVYSVRSDWCSWELTWLNRPKHNEKIGEFKVSQAGWYSLDLTDYIKLLIGENYYKLENNSILFKIKDGSTGYAILASTDNSVYPPFFEVNYRVEQ